MDNIYIDLRKQDCYIKDYFKGNDLISVQRLLDEFNELLSQMEDKDCIIEDLEEELKEIKQENDDEFDRRWNYECEQAEERQLQEHYRGE